MLDDVLRHWKDRLLNPPARLLQAVPPTIITAIGLLAGILSLFFLAHGVYAVGLIFWGVNRLLDGLDGSVARLHRQQSDLGGYADILADFTVYAGLPLALVISRPSYPGYLTLAFLLAAFYINAASWMYLAAILEKRCHKTGGELTTITMPAGLIGGTETIIFYTLFILWTEALPWLFSLMGGLVLVTVGQRFIWAVKNLD